MEFKLLFFSFSLAFVHGSVISRNIASVPVAAHSSYAAVYGVPVATRTQDCDPLTQYKFGYNVADTLTGDYKSQIEQRDGDLVLGQYSLVDSDGTLRIVEYSADSLNGFNAIVRNKPLVDGAPLATEPAVILDPTTTKSPIVNPPAVTSAPVSARYDTGSLTASSDRVTSPETAPAKALPRYSPSVTSTFSSTYSAPTSDTYSRAVAAPFTGQFFVPISASVSASYAPSVPSSYTAPLTVAYPASAYVATYASPLETTVYNTPLASAYTNLVANSLPASTTAVFTAVAPPASKLVEPIAAAGCP